MERQGLAGPWPFGCPLALVGRRSAGVDLRRVAHCRLGRWSVGVGGAWIGIGPLAAYLLWSPWASAQRICTSNTFRCCPPRRLWRSHRPPLAPPGASWPLHCPSPSCHHSGCLHRQYDGFGQGSGGFKSMHARIMLRGVVVYLMHNM